MIRLSDSGRPIALVAIALGWALLVQPASGGAQPGATAGPPGTSRAVDSVPVKPESAASPGKTEPAAAAPKSQSPPAPAKPEPPVGAPKAEPAPPPASPSPAPLPGADVKLRFNFRFQPWKDVLDWFAQQAGLSLVMDAPPAGTFNYTDDRDYTPTQAIDLLNSVLLTKGYTLVRRDRMLMLINLQDGVPPNLVPVVAPDELNKRGEYELVSVLFNVERLSPEEAELECKKLLGPQGSVVVLSSARQLLVTDIAGRLRAVRTVLERVDKSDGNTPGQVRTFDLKHAVPQTVLELLRQLLDIPADKFTAADGSIRLALDASNQRLLVSGKPEKLARVEEILKALDVHDAGKTEAAAAPVANSPQLEVYNITSADPESAMSVLQTLMNGMPDVRLALDAKNANLIAFARPEQQATIRATLDQLQRESRKIEVITLRRVDPQAAVATITKLFGGTDSGKAAPQVDADPTTRQLLVRASTGQLEQIRTLLKKLGEDPSEQGGGGTVRMLPLTGPSARAALDRILEIWPTLHESRIRVVAPSTPFPSVRTGVPETAPPEQGPLGEDRHGPPYGRHRRPPAEPEAEAGQPPQATLPPASQARPAPTQPPVASPKAQPAPATSAPAGPAASQPARPTSPTPAKNKSAHWSSARLILVSQPAAEASPVAKPQATPEPAAKASPTPPREPATIFVLPGPGGIVITSQDQQALDQFEDLLRSLTGSPSGKGSDFTIFYLKHTKAAAVAETLDGIFGGGTMPAQGGRTMGGAGGGDGGLFGSLMGMSGGSSAPSGAVHITPDTRLNALVVQGSPQDLDKVEQLLRVLDQQESPEDVAIAARPRIIPVYNSQASEVADIVKQIYADRMQGGSSGGSGGGQGGGGRFLQMLAMLRGPGGMGGPFGGGQFGGGQFGGGQSGRRGMFPGGGGRSAADEAPKMTIGVDTRANNLIVVAPESLFEEVRQLVEDIDRSAGQSTQAVRVVTLERTSVPALQQALGALTGGSVGSSTTTTAGPAGQAGALAGSSGQRGGYIPPAPQSSAQPAATASGYGRPGSYGGGGAGGSASAGSVSGQSAVYGRGYGAGSQQQGRSGYPSRQAGAYGGAARSGQAYGAGGRTNQAYGGASRTGQGSSRTPSGGSTSPYGSRGTSGGAGGAMPSGRSGAPPGAAGGGPPF